MRAYIITTFRFTLFLIFALTFTSHITFAQLNYQWVWQGGADVLDQHGSYGQEGISSLNNIPGARSKAVSWTDEDGNFWLYGGVGYDVGGTRGRLSDLWKYDVNSGMWLWVSGSTNADEGVIFGQQGISHQDNSPGGRHSSISWVGPEGDLWLMGGRTTDGDKNDLWKFNINNGNWTWINGSTVSSASIYGEKGIASDTTYPGSRYDAVSWTGKNGRLWLLGGQSSEPGVGGLRNDLWNYNIDTNQWTWVTGSDERAQGAVYGDKGTSGNFVTPGARGKGITWVDLQGNLWFMGGYASYVGSFNDLFKFDIDTEEWTWISGAAIPNQSGNYGTLGTASGSNVPGARYGASSWTDPEGNLWLYGGYGLDETGNQGTLGDLWKFDIDANMWVWVSGAKITDVPNSYDQQGIISSTANIGSRSGALSWNDKAGNTWIFGGNGYAQNENYGSFNDIWQLVTVPGVANFDGTSSFGQVDDTDEFSLGGKTEVTVEAWVSMSDFNNDNSLIGIVNRGQFLNSVGFTFQDTNTGIDLFFNHKGVSTVNSGLGYTGFSWENINSGQWYHLAGTYDGSNSKIYIDGQVVADSTASGTLSDPSSGSSDIYFGYEALFDTYFDGKLAEVRIWEKALSQDEIQAYMNQSLSGNEPGLLGGWLSRAGGSHSAVDQTGSGNNMKASAINYTSDFPPLKTVVSGTEGWRFLGAPGENVSYDELLEPIWTQGYLESDGGVGAESNVFYYDESTKSWGVPNSSSNTIGTNSNISSDIGKGTLVYVYADDNNDGSIEPFPKELSVNTYSPSLQNMIPLSFTESGFIPSDGWNLVSNPFPVAIYWGDVVNNGNNQGMLDYAYIWDHTMNNGAGGYRVHYGEPVPPAFPGANSDFDGRIPAFQSFWVKAEQVGASLKLQRSDFTLNRNVYKNAPKQANNDHINFTLEGQGYTDELSVIIPESDDQFRDEVPKLNALSGQYAEIFLPGDQGSRWMTRHIESVAKKASVTIPMAFETSIKGPFALSWDAATLPEDWSAELYDSHKNLTYDLRTTSKLQIESESYSSQKAQEGLVLPMAPGSQVLNKATNPRFEIILQKSVTTGSDPEAQLPKEFNLEQNYPNPFNPTTQINYAVPQAGNIQLVVYDMLGRKVSTLVDERLNPGNYSVSFDASKLASGIYVYRLKSGSIVMTKKLTLIK